MEGNIGAGQAAAIRRWLLGSVAFRVGLAALFT